MTAREHSVTSAGLGHGTAFGGFRGAYGGSPHRHAARTNQKQPVPEVKSHADCLLLITNDIKTHTVAALDNERDEMQKEEGNPSCPSISRSLALRNGIGISRSRL